MIDKERKEFKSKDNKRRSELRRKQLSSMSKADLHAYRKKDAARKKKIINRTVPEPTGMCKDVTPHSHYRSKQYYIWKNTEEEFKFLAKFSMKEDICDSWLS